MHVIASPRDPIPSCNVPVAYEGPHMQADEIVSRADGKIRRPEEREVVLGFIDDRVEVIGTNGGVAVHERKIAVTCASSAIGSSRRSRSRIRGARCNVRSELQLRLVDVSPFSVLAATSCAGTFMSCIHQVAHHRCVVAAHNPVAGPVDLVTRMLSGRAAEMIARPTSAAWN